MTTLRIELQVKDYELWRQAFANDQAGRAERGMRSYRILRPVDDEHRVLLDGEFDDPATAQAFLEIMRTQVWPDPTKAPSKLGQPRTTIAELVEDHAY